MLVSHDYKFIFLKTRKTAGSSIELLLRPCCAAPGVKVPETEFLSSRHGIIGAIRQTFTVPTPQEVTP